MRKLVAVTQMTNHGFHKLMGDQEMVIRGGFGVFYGAIVGDTALQQLTAPGFQGGGRRGVAGKR